MPDARSRQQPFHRRHVWRIATATGVLTLITGYIVADLDHTTARWLPPVAAAVAAVTLIVWLAEIRVTRRLARAEARQLSMEAQQAARQQALVAQLHSHIDQVALRVDIRMRMADYAEGYVDGLQRREPDHHERHLRPVP